MSPDAYDFSPDEFPEVTKIKSRLTPFQKARLCVIFSFSLIYAVYLLISYPFLKDKSINYKITAQAGIWRTLLGPLLTDDTMQKTLSFLPLSNVMDSLPEYKDKDNYNSPFVEAKESNSRWVYEKPSRTGDDPVILFIHGGGFQLKSNYNHVIHVRDICEKCGISGMLLDYAVVPYFKYPTQLNEALDTYKALSKTCNKIIISGHSAGGNLALALALKLKELGLNGHLFGLYVLSPYVELYPKKTGSWVRNKNKDWLHASFVKIVADEYTDNGKNADNKFAQPSLATEKDWEGAIPRNSIIIYANQELLHDQSETIAKKGNFTSRFAREGAIHDFSVMFERNGPNNDFLHRTIKQWLGRE